MSSPQLLEKTLGIQTSKMRDPSYPEMEAKRYRIKAKQYRNEAAKELNIHMKVALESIARGYDVRASKVEDPSS